MMIMNEMLHDKLFAVIRSGMGLEVPQIVLTQEECIEILKIGRRQSILPIILEGLKTNQIPSDYYKEYDSAWIKTLYQTVQQQDALKRVSNALESAAISYILLKGAVLRGLYPSAVLRTSCDIDILVREESLDSAVKVIEQNAGFKVIGHSYHDISMVDSHVHLELHFNIKENMENIDCLLEKAWEYAFPDKNDYCCKFSTEFQLFHVVSHMSYHMVHGGIGIRPFIDLWLLRNRTEYDEPVLRDMCSKCKILTFYEKSCSMVDSWMCGKKVDSSLSEYENCCLNGGVYGASETELASKKRHKRWIRYVWDRMFVNREWLETEFPEIRRKPYLIPSRQIKRWKRLLDKEKRRMIRQDINSLRSVDQETIEAFDALLTSLGL